MEKINIKTVKKGDLEILLGIVIIILVLVIGGGVVLAGMSGIVPGLSSAFGSDKPKDLGVDYSKVDVSGVHTKVGTSITTLPANTPLEKSARFEGEKKAKFSVSGEEISAMANKSPWKYFPFKSVQVKINNDGTGEASGIVKIERVFSFAQSLGYSSDDVKQAMEKYKVPVTDIPFYVKAKGDIVNNEVNANILNAELGRIPLPESIVKQAEPEVSRAASAVISSFPGFKINKLTMENGKVNFDGTVPEKQFLATE